MPQVLTATADVDMQVPFDNSAALEGLSRVHRVNDLFITDLVTQAVTGSAEHAATHTRTKRSPQNQHGRTKYLTFTLSCDLQPGER